MCVQQFSVLVCFCLIGTVYRGLWCSGWFGSQQGGASDTDSLPLPVAVFYTPQMLQRLLLVNDWKLNTFVNHR